MNWPSVGVVIPTRNRPELVRKAIAAVRDQRYPGDLKILVVYDQTEPDYLLASSPAAGSSPALVVLNYWRTGVLAAGSTTIILLVNAVVVAFCDDDQ